MIVATNPIPKPPSLPIPHLLVVAKMRTLTSLTTTLVLVLILLCTAAHPLLLPIPSNETSSYDVAVLEGWCQCVSCADLCAMSAVWCVNAGCFGVGVGLALRFGIWDLRVCELTRDF